MPIISTRKACWLMNTNHITAFGANPSQLFIPNKIPDPNFINIFQIVNHTHPILCSVSLVQLFQFSTGKITTIIRAEFCFAFGDLFAVSDFTCTTVFRFLTFFTIDPSTTWASILFSNVAPTKATIHSAWCNQICGNCWCFFSICFSHGMNVQFRFSQKGANQRAMCISS